MSFFVDDCVLETLRGPDPWGRRFEGRDDRHWVSGGRGCSEWLLSGTTTEGERIAVRGCDLFEFRDDKIARKDSYWKIVEA
jgi:hypothetical protein